MKETESNRVLIVVGTVIDHTAVSLLKAYDVHTLQCRIYHDTSKVRVDNKTIYAFRTDLLISSSKLLLHAFAQLILCSYIIYLEDHHFQSSDVESFFSKFPKSTTIRKWPQMLKFSQQTSNTACTGAEDHGSQPTLA